MRSNPSELTAARAILLGARVAVGLRHTPVQPVEYKIESTEDRLTAEQAIEALSLFPKPIVWKAKMGFDTIWLGVERRSLGSGDYEDSRAALIEEYLTDVESIFVPSGKELIRVVDDWDDFLMTFSGIRHLYLDYSYDATASLTVAFNLEPAQEDDAAKGANARLKVNYGPSSASVRLSEV